MGINIIHASDFEASEKFINSYLLCGEPGMAYRIEKLFKSSTIKKDEEIVFYTDEEKRIVRRFKLFNLDKFKKEYKEGEKITIGGFYIRNPEGLSDYIKNEGVNTVHFHVYDSFFDGEVNFRNLTFKEATFQDTIFIGMADFEHATFEGEVGFDNTSFSRTCFGNVKFKEGAIFIGVTFSREADFSRSVFNDYVDFRGVRCFKLNLESCINRDIIDLKSTGNIEQLSLIDMKNLGQIQTDWNWKNNNIKEMIENALPEKTHENYKAKADQYRMLKENFRNLGRYDEEDKAYVEFRRARRNILASFIEKSWDILLDKIGEYGTNPLRVLKSMGIVLMVFTLIFFIFPSMLDSPNVVTVNEYCTVASPQTVVKTVNYCSFEIFEKLNKVVGFIIQCSINFKTALYHSIDTFLTIGYGNVTPVNLVGIVLSGLEGFMGMFLMSYFTVALVRKTLR